MPRYVSIAFPYLLTEYVARKQPEFRGKAFVLASRQRGRMVIDAVSPQAMHKGIRTGMVLADCKAIFPELEMLESEPGRAEMLLQALAEWSIFYTPFAAIDLADGLILDSSGCTHLWGGEAAYLENIKIKLASYGYTIQTAIADTISAAWAMARFGNELIIAPGKQRQALQNLPPTALRLESTILARLKKLGMRHIGNFIDMPPSVLRRRFGPELPKRIAQALGSEIELVVPVRPIEPYQERLSSMEPIASATGITIAIKELLEILCLRFEAEGLGLRHCIFKAFRVDGAVQQIEIGTLMLPDGTEYAAKGQINVVDGQFSKNTGAITLRASFPNTSGLLRSGNTGNVRLDFTHAKALLVPQASTMEMQDKIFVYTVDSDNKVLRTPITILGKSGSDYLIKEGLKPGDRIVYKGFEALKDGAVITPEKISPELAKN